MIDKINTEETIRQNRMSLSRNIFDKLYHWFFYIVLIIIFPALSISYTLSNLDSLKTDLFGQIISNVLTFGFALFIISGIRQSFQLATLEGGLLNENKELILEIIKLNKWILYKEFDDYVIIATKRYKSQINVIFNQDIIHINSITFGWHDIISPFFIVRNRDNIDKIKEEFEKKYALQHRI